MWVLNICVPTLLVDKSNFLPVEGAVLPNQIPLSLRGSLHPSRYTQPWGGRGRGRPAGLSESEAVADQACWNSQDLPQCLGPAW